jgi:hypothetical protein
LTEKIKRKTALGKANILTTFHSPKIGWFSSEENPHGQDVYLWLTHTENTLKYDFQKHTQTDRQQQEMQRSLYLLQ